MAELADALGSGPSEGNFIGVQVPFRASTLPNRERFFMPAHPYRQKKSPECIFQGFHD